MTAPDTAADRVNEPRPLRIDVTASDDEFRQVEEDLDPRAGAEALATALLRGADAALTHSDGTRGATLELEGRDEDEEDETLLSVDREDGRWTAYDRDGAQLAQHRRLDQLHAPVRRAVRDALARVRAEANGSPERG